MHQEELSKSAQVRSPKTDNCAQEAGPGPTPGIYGAGRQTGVERATSIFSSRPLTHAQVENIELIKANAAMLFASMEASLIRGPGGTFEAHSCFDSAKKALEEAVMWAVKGVSRQNNQAH